MYTYARMQTHKHSYARERESVRHTERKSEKARTRESERARERESERATTHSHRRSFGLKRFFDNLEGASLGPARLAKLGGQQKRSREGELVSAPADTIWTVTQSEQKWAAGVVCTSPLCVG